MMRLKIFRLLLIALLLLSTTFATVAQAQSEGSEGDNKQTPVQVVVTAIALRILHRFDLP